ncbi:LysR family transcriptional regulator [Hoeflea sp. Naph1]|uniref:LysR family transcriptional regulator n=1 Tax=Hoeflea sp. Naph1 TaxID=3388653 RepID=UPI00398F91A4
MNIELAKTFIAIVSTGSFLKASERLNVAQTTVSARIRTLEQLLGRDLFIRHKGGATLTPAGQQFLHHAPMFIQLWQRTLHQVAVPPGRRAVLTVGSEVSLAQPLLLNWIQWIREAHADIALRVRVDVPKDMISHVASGEVDLAIMYAPQHLPGLKIDLLMEEKLVFATTDPKRRFPDNSDYIYMDWGAEFTLQHEMNFPDVTPDIQMDLGPLALNYILSAGGSGYFRLSTLQPYVASGKLHLVPEMPMFSYPVYAVQSINADRGVADAALAGLHAVANSKTERSDILI